MGPKTKSAISTRSSKRVTKVLKSESWIDELKLLMINDDSWQCNVSMVVETTPYNFEYVEAVKSEYSTRQNPRPKIKFISDIILATDMLESYYNANINSYSPEYKQLCETALKYCSNEGFSNDTPVPILASLIKYYIYHLKQRNIAEALVIARYKEKKQKAKEESILNIQNIMKDVSKEENPGKGGKSNKSTAKKPKSNLSRSSTKQTDKGKFTELRKRNEEILDTISKQSDEPLDPKLFIVLTSFKQTELPLELLKLQVPLVAVIKLHDFCTLLEYNFIGQELNAKVCKGLKRVSIIKTIKQITFVHPKDQFLSLKHTLDAFWNDFLKILSDKNNVSAFQDTIFLKFFPKLCENTSLGKKSILDSVCSKIKESLYDQFCYLQYDIQDIIRQHINYVSHLKDCNIKENFFYPVDELMSLYMSLVEPIPPEIMNIPFILSSMLSQVELLVGTTTRKPSDNTDLSFDGNKNLVDPMKDTVLLNSSEAEENSLSLKLAELEVTYDLNTNDQIDGEETVLPKMLIHGDETGIKAQWWDTNNYIKTTTCNILECFWDQLLFKHLLAYDDISGHTDDNSIFSMVQNTSTITMLHKLCNLPCSFKDETLIVEDKSYVFCTDEETDRTVYKRSFCNIHQCKHTELTGLKHYKNPIDGQYLGQIYDQHSFCFEEMASDVMLQNLFNSYKSFNCVDLFQDYFAGQILVKFHHKRSCCKEEYLMGTLKTKIALRDFYDYMIEEEFYWLNEQELLFDRMAKKGEHFKKWQALKWMQYLEDRRAARTGKICSEKMFILKNTLKQSQTLNDILSPILSYTKEELQVKSNSIINDTADMKAFDIDLPNRVQFSEKRQEFIISENSKLQVTWLYRLYKSESVSLHVEIHGHTLYFLQPFDEKMNGNFHLIHESGMIFDFKKSTIEAHHAPGVEADSQTKEEKKASVRGLKEEGVRGIFLKPLMFEFNISLPNSLCFELINPDNIELYFKQHYLTQISLPTQLKEENYRCYLLDGTIIKFMNDETVIIYYPNGEIFKCYMVSPKASTNNDTSSMKSHNPPTFAKPSFSLLPSIESYEQTLANGRRILVTENRVVELEPLFYTSHTDIFNGTIVSTRSDGTTITYNTLGTMFTDFPDGSRITTRATFVSDEVYFESDVISFDIIEKNIEGFNKHESNYDMESELEQSFETNYEELNYFEPKSQSFVVINIQHFFEHNNFASVVVDRNIENFEIFLPFNVSITLSSEGLYNINFSEKAEFITEFKKLIFRDINSVYYPEFIINLDNKINYASEKEQNEINNITTIDDVIADAVNFIDKEMNNIDGKAEIYIEGNKTNYMFFCRDENGNTITINHYGEIKFKLIDGTDSICKCNLINADRYFILDTNFNGLEVFLPNVFELALQEAKNTKNCVVVDKGSVDHNVLLILKPLVLIEKEKWLMPLKDNKKIPLCILPSTYNDEHTSYNPFPKTKVIPSNDASKTIIPNVVVIRSVNRVNCNIHLKKDTFTENKKLADDLRINKSPDLLVQIYSKSTSLYCKADKTVIDFIKDNIIGSLLSRVRSRVVKRIEMRKIGEYLDMLMYCILPPYFESSHGAVHVILLEVLYNVVTSEAANKTILERIFAKDLHKLTDNELTLMHDTIAKATNNKFCNCDEKGEFCQIKILLLAGRTLHNMFSGMLEVLQVYGMLSKRKREENEEILKNKESLMKLLNMPIKSLTEHDALLLHDKLISLANIDLCTCHDNSKICKLKATILAGIVLDYVFPNMNAVLKASKISIEF